ncbi:hypothetical protein GJAV_G00176590 [Gymnothorax javanicus]|nr:hypothetical protein GJAV_G00176590 [Gymnothorax javanicus]
MNDIVMVEVRDLTVRVTLTVVLVRAAPVPEVVGRVARLRCVWRPALTSLPIFPERFTSHQVPLIGG